MISPTGKAIILGALGRVNSVIGSLIMFDYHGTEVNDARPLVIICQRHGDKVWEAANGYKYVGGVNINHFGTVSMRKYLANKFGRRDMVTWGDIQSVFTILKAPYRTYAENSMGPVLTVKMHKDEVDMEDFDNLYDSEIFNTPTPTKKAGVGRLPDVYGGE